MEFLLMKFCLLSLLMIHRTFAGDNLALLSATLRTYQRAGCDSEQLSLSCPRGTSISIELAQYGRAGDPSDTSLCPPTSDDDATTSLLDGVVHSGTEIEVKPPESCLWPNALQYSLLQTVVEACQKKRHCKFAATPKSIAGDPCPGIRKFVEIAYKCRPYEFRSKVACENDVMQLICNPYSRIAIYSASFGRQEYESVQCSQPQGTKEETCLVSYATETVMQICHGRRRCTLTADSSTFGKPCKPDTRMYLKVVYTCIPRKVLKDRYETVPEQDEPQQTEFDLDQDDLYDEDQFYKESEAIPPAPKLQGGLTNHPSQSIEFPFSGSIGGFGDLTSSVIPPILSRNDSSLEENQERFYLYLIVSISVGILLCLTLIIGRLIIQKRKRSITTKNKNNDTTETNTTKSSFQQSTNGETQLPNGFNDDISEIDADIDLTAPLPVPSVSSSRNEQNYMTYAPSPSPYGSLAPSNVSHTSTTMLVPSGGLIMTGVGSAGNGPGSVNGTSGSGGGIGGGRSNSSSSGTGPGSSSMGGCGSGGGGSRQPTPPPSMISSSNTLMGPPVSGALGPLMPISSVSQHHSTVPSYLQGSVMISHHGTLRRPFIPTSSGIVMAPPTSLSSVHHHPQSSLIPPPNIRYDGTLPRNMGNRISGGGGNVGMPPSSDGSAYFYG